MTDHLNVLLGGTVAGDLTRDRAGTLTFSYTTDYSTRGLIPLSPSLPVGAARFKHPQISAYLEGLLPERSDVRAAWAAQLRTTDNAFDLLAGMGKDCVGAVQFVTDAEVDTIAARAATYKPVAAKGIGRRLRALRDEAGS